MIFISTLRRAFAIVSLLSQANAFWRMGCSRLEMGRLDPVVQPGAVSAHAHTIVGGSNFGVNVTGATLLESECTSCELTADKSAYWTPLLYYQYPNGTFIDVPHTGAVVYYLGRGDNDTIVPFPPGFRMVAGSAAVRSFDPVTTPYGGTNPLSNRVSWLCITDPPTPQTPGFHSSDCPSGLRAQITFPTCWDGVNLYKSDQSHVAYLSNVDTGFCPPSHPYQTMQIFIEVLYSVNSIQQVDGGRLMLSTGDPTGYSLHADFQNAWDQDVLEDAISQCSSTFDSGVIDDCAPLQAVHQTDTEIICPYRSTQVNETVSGLLNKLPGCITITPGPGAATSLDTTCPPTVTQPKIITTANSVPIVVDTVPNGSPQGLDGWDYLGCADDSGATRVLDGITYENDTGMSVEVCQQYCLNNNKKYAGVEFGSQCFCSNYLSTTVAFPNETQFSLGCYFPCKGKDSEYCGGRALIDVYNHVDVVLLPQPSVQPIAQGYYSKGCYGDSTTNRAISATPVNSENNMTPDHCAKYCSDATINGAGSFRIFGVEFGRECYCGNTMNYFQTAPISDCNMLCSGDSGQLESYCGAGDRLNVYYNPTMS